MADSQPPPLRSQPTRDRIFAAARKVFAVEGYERATVRLVATEAQANPALVIRYFGSKEGLFAAAVRFDLRLPDLRGVDPGSLGERLVAHFIERWEGVGSKGELQSLLRASVTHEGARKAMADIFQTQLAAAVARATGPERAEVRAGLVASQMLGLALGRYILKLPGLATLAPEQIVSSVGPTVQRYLTA